MQVIPSARATELLTFYEITIQPKKQATGPSNDIITVVGYYSGGKPGRDHDGLPHFHWSSMFSRSYNITPGYSWFFSVCVCLNIGYPQPV